MKISSLSQPKFKVEKEESTLSLNPYVSTNILNSTTNQNLYNTNLDNSSDNKDLSTSYLSNLIDVINENNLNVFYDDKEETNFKHNIDQLNLKFYLETEKILNNDKEQQCNEIVDSQNKLFVILFKQISLYIKEIERLNSIILNNSKDPILFQKKVTLLSQQKLNFETKELMIQKLKHSNKILEKKYSQLLINENKLRVENENLKKQIKDYETKYSELSTTSNRFISNFFEISGHCKNFLSDNDELLNTLNNLNNFNSNKNLQNIGLINNQHQSQFSQITDINSSSINYNIINTNNNSTSISQANSGICKNIYRRRTLSDNEDGLSQMYDLEKNNISKNNKSNIADSLISKKLIQNKLKNCDNKIKNLYKNTLFSGEKFISGKKQENSLYKPKSKKNNNQLSTSPKQTILHSSTTNTNSSKTKSKNKNVSINNKNNNNSGNSTAKINKSTYINLKDHVVLTNFNKHNHNISCINLCTGGQGTSNIGCSTTTNNHNHSNIFNLSNSQYINKFLSPKNSNKQLNINNFNGGVNKIIFSNKKYIKKGENLKKQNGTVLIRNKIKNNDKDYKDIFSENSGNSLNNKNEGCENNDLNSDIREIDKIEKLLIELRDYLFKKINENTSKDFVAKTHVQGN